MLRGRREDRREERRDDREFGRRGSGNTRYQMRQRLGTIGDDFWIENEAGQKVFKVDGKALRLRKTLKFEDAQGRELCHIQEKVARIKESMEIEGPNGDQLAMVKKALITPVRSALSPILAVAPISTFREISLTTNTLSRKAATKLPKSPRNGSDCATPTAWKLSRVKTTS